MECPICENRTKTIDSRPWLGTRYRKRECLECGARFWTIEQYCDEEDMKDVRDLLAYERMKVRDKKWRD